MYYEKIKNFKFFYLNCLFLESCNGKLPGSDARKFPADPKKRVENNLKEGRGFRLSGEDGFFSNRGGGVYEFATSNELWRASLDTIDFTNECSIVRMGSEYKRDIAMGRIAYSKNFGKYSFSKKKSTTATLIKKTIKLD